MRKKILVIGSANVDLIMQLEHIPRIGETVSGGQFTRAYGGKGANQALAAARAGAQVDLIAALGTDDYAASMIENFKKDGIGIRRLVQKENFATGTALILIDAKGRNCIAVAPGANHELNGNDIDNALPLIKESDLILLQCELATETLHHLIFLAHRHHKKLLLNLAPAKLLEASLLKKVDLLIVNETEAEFLCEIPPVDEVSIREAAKKIRTRVGGGVIITLGKAGSYFQVGEESGSVQAFRVKATDTTAAGDVFCGSLAVALVEGKNIREAIRFASAAAALAVTRLGAQPSVPHRTEIEVLLASSPD